MRLHRAPSSRRGLLARGKRKRGEQISRASFLKRKGAINNNPQDLTHMLATSLPLAAAGWSLLYLLLGGGLFGAVVIFVVAKMIGK